MPDDDRWVYEVVEGRLVRIPASGGEASPIALRLAIALGAFVHTRNLGQVTGADGEYDFAREQLARNRPPAEVAIEAGFADQAHFSRMCKATFGGTPALYRALSMPERSREAGRPARG